MITLDLPPLWTPAKPAIIRPAELTQFRFVVNDGKEWDCGACLPRDFAAMPPLLRALIAPDEIRGFLPEPYRRLSDDMIRSLVANLGGLPGVLMAGGVRTSWLYIATSTFSVPGDFNNEDNCIQGVGAGGNGQPPTASSFFTGEYYGGSGAGGGAWAALDNAVLVAFTTYTVHVGETSGDWSWFDSTTRLLAVAGANGNALSGGTAAGGAGGDKTSCIGNRKSSGLSGGSTSAHGITCTGGYGGSAGGPNGDATSLYGDAGYGGRSGDQVGFNQFDGQDGIYGPGGGWRPNETPNAGSGGGGGRGTGTSGSGADPYGHNGGKYGGGGGGGGVTADPFSRVGTGGSFAPGCVLITNNSSL
jgi:hypothetical protein